LERAGYWATINLASSHNSTLPEIRKTYSHKNTRTFRILPAFFYLGDKEGLRGPKK
jgi:hypothetical protein